MTQIFIEKNFASIGQLYLCMGQKRLNNNLSEATGKNAKPKKKPLLFRKPKRPGPIHNPYKSVEEIKEAIRIEENKITELNKSIIEKETALVAVESKRRWLDVLFDDLISSLPSWQPKELRPIVRPQVITRPPNGEALGIARELSEEYGVKIWFVQTIKEYESDELLAISASERVHFLCLDDLVRSEKQTVRLIKYEREKQAFEAKETYERQKTFLEKAHAIRTEQVTKDSIEYGKTIDEIKSDYRTDHAGKDPSLHKIAEILNSRHVDTPSGKGTWRAKAVQRIINRNNQLPEKQ